MRVWQGEDIPYPIFDHVLTALILVVYYSYLWIYFSSNYFKLYRAWKLRSYHICYYLLLDGLCTELTIIYRSLTVFGFLVILVPWNNSVIILSGQSESINVGIWVHYWPSNYIPIIFLVWSATERTISFNFWPFHRIWPLKNHPCRYWSLWSSVAYCFSLWVCTFYLYRLLFLLPIEKTMIRLNHSWIQPLFQILLKLPLILEFALH